jgi:hypothetical protein
MADHGMFFTLPERQLGRADIEVWLPAKEWGKSEIRIGRLQFDKFARTKK